MHQRLVNAFYQVRKYSPSKHSNYAIFSSLSRCSRLVSDRFGIIRKVQFQFIRPDEPRVFWAHASSPSFFQGSKVKLSHDGFGISVLPERALIKAIGESIERYCAFPPNLATLGLGNVASMSADCRTVKPNEFALFSPAQYADPALPFEAPDSKHSLVWAKGVSLVSGEPVLVPASFVYVPYGPQISDYPPEPRFAVPISTGLACGPTYSSAVYRGLLEVIERDAFMLSWRHELVLPSLDTSQFRGHLTQSLLQAISEIPVNCIAKLATVDISVSVVLVMLTAKTQRFPLFAMGAGADLDTEHALNLALEEALLCYIGLGRVESPKEVDEATELASGVNPLALYGLAHATDPALEALRRCLVEPTDLVSNVLTQRRHDTIGDLVDELSNKGYEAIAVDLTPDDVDAVGFKVVRVLVPGLQPLDVVSKWPYLGTARSDVMISALGNCRSLHSKLASPRMPHPFS